MIQQTLTQHTAHTACLAINDKMNQNLYKQLILLHIRFIVPLPQDAHLVIIQVQRSKGSAPPDRLGEGLRPHRRDPVEAKLQQTHGPIPPQSVRQPFQTLVSNLVVAHVQIAGRRQMTASHNGVEKKLGEVTN